MLFLNEPLGSLLSGWITEQIGRKNSTFLASIPLIIAWTMFYFAENTLNIFVAGVLYGFGTGLLGAPILTYIGEVT